MNRALILIFGLVVVSGCAAPPERVPLMPLPDDGQPLPYADMLQRTRSLATSANEAFFVNKWTELEEAAKSMEKAARLLPKSTEVPPPRKERLETVSGDLLKEATRLREAARDKDEQRTNDALQRITLKVRELRPEN